MKSGSQELESDVESNTGSIPDCPKNCAETDENIGLVRMRRLVPYARAQLGIPIPPAEKDCALTAGRISLKRDLKQLSVELRCGVDLIRQFVMTIRKKGIENVRGSDFLKKAPGGGRGKCKVPHDIRQTLVDVVKTVCVDQGRAPGSSGARKAISAEMIARGVSPRRVPGRRALNLVSTMPEILRQHTAAVEGEHMCRVVGMDTQAMALNQVIYMDATTHSSESEPEECLYALDTHERNLGLVNIIYGLECASRCVWTALGFVGAPNSFLTALSIHRGLLQKNDLLAKYNIKGIFPIHGKPRHFYTDRGNEFIRKQTVRVLKDMDIGFVDKSPPRVCIYRAKSERFNRTAHTLFADFLHSEEGKRYFRPVPGIPNATGILLRDLDKALLEWIVIRYHSREHNGLGGANPLERFFDMANGERGFPMSGFPPPVADSDDLMWDFLWEEPRVINHMGISLFNRRYFDSKLTSFLLPGKRSSISRHSVRLNPYGIGKVFVRVPNGERGGEIYRIPYMPDNDVLPMTREQRSETMDPSLWEWTVARSDLLRVGNDKPTPEEVAGVIAARHSKIDNPEQGTSSGVITRRDLANREMSEIFAKNEPVVVETANNSGSFAQSEATALSKTFRLLPTGSGGADEY
jgi:hypothetical protein